MVCRGRGKLSLQRLRPTQQQQLPVNGQFNYSEEATSEICLPGLGHLGHTAAFDRSWPALDSSNCASLMSCAGCYNKRGPS